MSFTIYDEVRFNHVSRNKKICEKKVGQIIVKIIQLQLETKRYLDNSLKILGSF